MSQKLSVPTGTLPGMDPTLNGLVDAVESGSVELAETLLRGAGVVRPPTVHMLHKHLMNPYVGSVWTRPFRRGADAAAAVSVLGLLPSVVHATRLVVVWEHSDMSEALDRPGWRDGQYPLGLVVLDADLAEHVVRWHPFHLRTDVSAGSVGDGVSVWPQWGTAERYPGGTLPGAVSELLLVWREWLRRDISETRATIEAAGFGVQWTAEPTVH